MSAFVYAFAREDGAIKIGYSKQPSQRFSACGGVKFIGLRELPDAASARRLEGKLHGELDRWSLGKEWFAPSAVVLASAESLGPPNVPVPTVSFTAQLPAELVRRARCFAAENDTTAQELVIEALAARLQGYVVTP